MIFGTTFSHPHLNHLGINIDLALDSLLDLGLQIVRLGVYQNQYDQKVLDKIISFLRKHDRQVVLVIGKKSPRWPEFYTDPAQDILVFTKKTINHFKKYKNIIAWQIENEPLDPSGPDNQVIDLDTLQQQINLAKKLDPRPTLFNLWGNTLTSRKLLDTIPPNIDILGLDLYTKVPINPHIPIFNGPQDSPENIKKMLKKTSKTFWITELQAEDWSPYKLTPQDLVANIKYAELLQPEVCLLWGFEHWLDRKLKGDACLWDTVKSSI